VSTGTALLAKPGFILKQVSDVLGLLTNISALVFPIVVDVLELLQSLDNINVVAEVDDDVLRACVKTIIEDSECLTVETRDNEPTV
jgi:hypothetical protein